ncbi:FAR1 DNA-binding domain, partial [Musa troglodytarum]
LINIGTSCKRFRVSRDRTVNLTPSSSGNAAPRHHQVCSKSLPAAAARQFLLPRFATLTQAIRSMEHSSSEDDELVEDYLDFEDDIKASDVNHQNEEATASVAGSNMVLVEQAIGNELLAADDGDAKNQVPCLGMEFESDTVARAFYNAYALRLGFGIRVARSRSERRKGVEVMVMKRFVCLKEGHHKKKVTENGAKKKRKRLSIRDGCPAMMEVVRRAPEKWVVTKLVLEHTHMVVSPERVREIQLSRLSGKDREHQDFLKEMRRRLFGEGDAQVLLEYFKRMQAENAGFFYAMQGTTLRYPMEQMCLVESVPGWAPPPPTQPVGQLPHPHLWDGLKRVLIVPTCWI